MLYVGGQDGMGGVGAVQSVTSQSQDFSIILIVSESVLEKSDLRVDLKKFLSVAWNRAFQVFKEAGNIYKSVTDVQRPFYKDDFLWLY